MLSVAMAIRCIYVSMQVVLASFEGLFTTCKNVLSFQGCWDGM